MNKVLIVDAFDSDRRLMSGLLVKSGYEPVAVESNYKYKFNNGFIAMSDNHAACMNFVNALEKIPGIIAQYEERTAKPKADVPQLEAIVAKSWGKEEELKQLKSDLAALDRKITATLAPKKEEQDGEENNQQPDTQRVEVRDNRSQTNGSKETMVAEPSGSYQREPLGSRIIIGGCGATPSGGFRAAANWQNENRYTGPKL